MSNGNDNGTGITSSAHAIASALVALGFLGLVAIIFWRATESNQNFDKVWAATGLFLLSTAGTRGTHTFSRPSRSQHRPSRNLLTGSSKRSHSNGPACF
jgi:predicted amidohydrolase